MRIGELTKDVMMIKDSWMKRLAKYENRRLRKYVEKNIWDTWISNHNPRARGEGQLINQEKEKQMSQQLPEFKQYRRKSISEMRPYIEGEDMTGVSVSLEDVKNGSPKVGDMIARNPKNYADQWLVAQQYFQDNLEPIEN